MSNPFVWIFVFCFGLCVGSFLNVCISRLPEGGSIIHPGSRCPKCNTPIRFYDNIPVLSYILLGGRCRQCRTGISPRYPVIELVTGAMACCIFLKYGPSASALIYFIFSAALIAVTFIDIDHQIIPDEISLPGIPAGFATSFVLAGLTYTDALLGILTGGGSLFLLAMGYHLATGKEGMGGGDIKLLAMNGAFIGWKGVIFTIFISSVIGTLVGMAFMAIFRKNLKFAIPFGPFLSLGAIVYLFFGQSIINWYFLMSRPY